MEKKTFKKKDKKKDAEAEMEQRAGKGSVYKEQVATEKLMESRGRYKLRKECGVHYIHDNPLLEIENKPHKRVVFPGDVLLAPPRLVKHVQDKFLRLDSVTDSAEEAVRMEEERSVAHIDEKDEGEYFVITAQGIRLNDKPLNKEQAEQCLKIELEDEEERKEPVDEEEEVTMNE